MDNTPKICSVEDCDRAHYGLGYCNAHWQQYKKLGHIKSLRKFRSGRTCEFNGCERPVAGPNYCQTHQKAFNRGEALKPIRDKAIYTDDSTCLIDWCEQRPFAGGYCKKHKSLNKFNLSPETVYRLFPKSDTRCNICGSGPGSRALHIDHDHNHCRYGCDECVRGILCKSCNHGIGFLKDDIDILSSAIKYLEMNKNYE